MIFLLATIAIIGTGVNNTLSKNGIATIRHILGPINKKMLAVRLKNYLTAGTILKTLIDNIDQAHWEMGKISQNFILKL